MGDLTTAQTPADEVSWCVDEIECVKYPNAHRRRSQAFYRANPYNYYQTIFTSQDEIAIMNDSIDRIIADELQVRAEQVETTVRTFYERNIRPFIAPPYKEVNGGLDPDSQPQNLEARLGYLHKLEDRTQAIFKLIGEQVKPIGHLAKDIN